MRKPVAALEISAGQRELLESVARSQSGAHREVVRAKALLMASQGVANSAIAQGLSVSPASVANWRARFAEDGMARLGQVRKGRGRKPSIPQETIEEILDLTQNYRPQGQTHWSCRTMAEAVGVSKDTVQRVWSARGLKPHRVETFKLSNDPRFDEKLVDVVGLYLNPPEKAIVLCADEKSSVQALDRTQASLPMIPGRAQTMTHDYKRHGTTTLFAALDVLTGTVIGRCLPRHRHRTVPAPAPSSGVREVPARHRPRGPHRVEDSPDPRQLRHPQTPRRAGLAGQTSPVPAPLHPDLIVVAQSRRTLVPRADRQGIAARGISFRARSDRLNRGIPRRAQRRPPPLRVDRHSRINPRQSRTRPHRPRKSQLIQRHTTSTSRLCQGRLPPSPAPPGSGCPQLRSPAATEPPCRSLTSTRSTSASRRTPGQRHVRSRQRTKSAN